MKSKLPLFSPDWSGDYSGSASLWQPQWKWNNWQNNSLTSSSCVPRNRNLSNPPRCISFADMSVAWTKVVRGATQHVEEVLSFFFFTCKKKVVIVTFTWSESNIQGWDFPIWKSGALKCREVRVLIYNGTFPHRSNEVTGRSKGKWGTTKRWGTPQGLLPSF